MSEMQTSVEWVFRDILNYFAFLDFKKNLKIGPSSVGKMYITCALIRIHILVFMDLQHLTTLKWIPF